METTGRWRPTVATEEALLSSQEPQDETLSKKKRKPEGNYTYVVRSIFKIKPRSSPDFLSSLLTALCCFPQGFGWVFVCLFCVFVLYLIPVFSGCLQHLFPALSLPRHPQKDSALASV